MNAALSLLLLIAGAVSIFGGTLFLAVGLPRNWSAIVGTGSSERHRRLARHFGVAMLIAGFIVGALRDGAGFAVLSWFLLFASGSLLTALVLAYRPRVAGCVAELVRRMWITRR